MLFVNLVIQIFALYYCDQEKIKYMFYTYVVRYQELVSKQMIPAFRPRFLECQNGNFTENSFTVVWYTDPQKTKTENEN
jgi:hypothetical protein